MDLEEKRQEEEGEELGSRLKEGGRGDTVRGSSEERRVVQREMAGRKLVSGLAATRWRIGRGEVE